MDARHPDRGNRVVQSRGMMLLNQVFALVVAVVSETA
jgi:hypothetical protein